MNTHLFSLTLMMLLAALLIRPCVNGEKGVLLPSVVSDAGCCRLMDGRNPFVTDTERLEDGDARPLTHDGTREVSPADRNPSAGRRIRVIWSNGGGNCQRWNPFS